MADFVQTLMEMRGGAVAVDCNRKLNELLASVLETRKKGKLTLSVEIAPSRIDVTGEVKEVDLRHHCSVSKPELDNGRSIFFTTQDGRLSRQDPNQMDLEGLDVGERKEVR